MKIFLLSAAVLFTMNINAQWTGAVLDSLTQNTSRDEVNHQCIDLDETNNLHVVYSRANPVSGWNIFYKQRNTNSVWTTEDSITSQVAFSPVIAASNIAGEAFVAYQAMDSSEEIHFSSNAGGIWNDQLVTNDNVADMTPTIDADSMGHVHLAWVSEITSGDYRIKYATNMSGSWVTQTLTGSQLGMFGSGAMPEIAVDKSGNAHIAYRGDNGTGYKIHHAYNNSPGGTIWSYDYIATPNDEDLSVAIQVSNDTVVHLLISGDDGFGFPVKAYYVTKPFGGSAFTPAVDVAPTYDASVGDIYTDNDNIPHFVLNEVSGNIYTGNVIYANSGNFNGIMLLNTMDTYNANLVVEGVDRAYLAAYKGNSFPDEEVVVYGYMNQVGINQADLKESPINIITSEDKLIISFKENYSGNLTCTTIEGKIIFEQDGNYTKGEVLSIDELAIGIYMFCSENKEGRSVMKVVVR